MILLMTKPRSGLSSRFLPDCNRIRNKSAQLITHAILKKGSMSGGLMVSQYSTTEDILWAHGEPILNDGGCPMGSWWANTQLWRVSCELMVTQYSTTEGVLWAHGRPILIYRRCLVSSWWPNTQLRRVSCELIVGQYSSTEGVLWAHGEQILNYGRCPVSSW